MVRRDEAIETARGLRWIEWQDVSVRGSVRGRPEVQSVGRDVTARRDAEQAAARARDAAEAASQAKSRFLATVTHEIRTPLGGILGMADLLLHTGLSPDQATYANAVKTSGGALLSLIDEILDFSKIEAGRLDLDEKPFDARPPGRGCRGAARSPCPRQGPGDRRLRLLERAAPGRRGMPGV